MKKILLLLLILTPSLLRAQQRYNLDMETTDVRTALPAGWTAFTTPESDSRVSTDSTTVYSGRYAIRLTKDSSRAQTPGIAAYTVPVDFYGRTIKLRGYVRTEAVEGGWAGLWMRVDGTAAFDNMQQRGIKGTTPWTPYEIVLKLDGNATQISLGGLLTGKGRVWIDSLTLFVDGKNAQLIPAEDIAAKTAEMNWLKTHAMPLKAVDAGHGGDDLQGLKPLIGNARIVALGECTHGSGEVFRVKHRLLEFLVTEMGFRIFAIEANLPEASIMNEYVLYGKGTAEKGLDALYFWTWHTREVLEMAKWMRAYNIAHPDKMVQFTGFDMQYSKGACDNLLQFAAQYAAELKPLMDSVVRYCDRLKTAGADQAFSREDKVRLKEWLEQAGDLLKKNQRRYTQQAGDSIVEWQARNLVVLQQYFLLATQYGSSFNIRDKAMAENIEWLAKRYPGQKIVLWAHNGHVSRHPALMGGHLDKTFKKQMVVIGFGTAKGSYTAIKKGEIKRDNVLAPPVPRSFEGYAQASGIGNFILDIRKRQLQEEPASWLLRYARLRSIGSMAMDGGNAQFEYNILPDAYDALIYLDNTSASEVL
ncbi:erythromycin esterase family protein [Chitinophaga oryzae]|uniref:Erythromycin esterase family protein n=1 Tax=Chitinophaga oryzae TaxID=2725414 RepID=A0AAE6ZCH1_9BACT|nr:erythromycin esterase family protein [Chitinophaga oryzae]QJB30034.1 erythromycin esterase family protein [Chitinophaga oryzae]